MNAQRRLSPAQPFARDDIRVCMFLGKALVGRSRQAIWNDGYMGLAARNCNRPPRNKIGPRPGCCVGMARRKPCYIDRSSHRCFTRFAFAGALPMNAQQDAPVASPAALAAEADAQAPS